MDELLLAGILLGGLAMFSGTSPKGSVIPAPYGSVKSGKFVPTPQKSFKDELDFILTNLQNELEITNLRDYFITIGWIESRFFPSAIAYKPGQGYHPDLFPKNKWRGSKVLWEYTGGLFQLFPFVGLDTVDNYGKNLSPTSVFDPYYTIAFAIDLAYRFNWKYDANNWFEVRLAWRSLRTLQDQPEDEVAGVKGRLLKSAKENEIDPGFLFEDLDFGKYNQYGFRKTLQLIYKYRENFKET